jgi:hypothetical protein
MIYRSDWTLGDKLIDRYYHVGDHEYQPTRTYVPASSMDALRDALDFTRDFAQENGEEGLLLTIEEALGGEVSQPKDIDRWTECVDCGWSRADDWQPVILPGEHLPKAGEDCPRCGVRLIEAMDAADHLAKVEELVEARVQEPEHEKPACRHTPGTGITCPNCELEARARRAEREELAELLREWADREEAKSKHIPGAAPGYAHVGTLRRAGQILASQGGEGP